MPKLKRVLEPSIITGAGLGTLGLNALVSLGSTAVTVAWVAVLAGSVFFLVKKFK